VLLDLDQKTLPGIAHQVVEQMIISDQIKAEDRANVLRALLLKHRYTTTTTPKYQPGQLSGKYLLSI
jgi:solute carrier family 4 anion exchanger 2